MSKRINLLVALLVATVAALWALPTFAAAPAHAGAAGVSFCPSGGHVVVDVYYNVRNDVDSGVAGNNWAFDNYVKGIRIWKYTDGSFCAVSTYAGQFTTIAGASPQNTGLVGAGIMGAFAGGYVSTVFHGALQPNVQTQGSLGTKDFGCNASGSTCQVYDWLGYYFGTSPADFNLAKWGWFYQTRHNGWWLNASSGNLGDITGS